MIPTMIVLGFALGRWWRTALIAAAVVWPALLLGGGGLDGSPLDRLGMLVAGGLLAAANAAVGVAAHQVVRFTVDGTLVAARHLRARPNRRPAQR